MGGMNDGWDFGYTVSLSLLHFMLKRGMFLEYVQYVRCHRMNLFKLRFLSLILLSPSPPLPLSPHPSFLGTIKSKHRYVST